MLKALAFALSCAIPLIPLAAQSPGDTIPGNVRTSPREANVLLPAMRVVEDGPVRRVLSGFYRRRESGAGGHFFQRADIEKRGAQRLSDMMRTLAGVDVRTGVDRRLTTRMSRAFNVSRNGDCGPDMYVDGIRAPGLGVDDIQPSDVEAVEVYKGPATVPPEFRSKMGNAACGVIAIWTRVPSR